MAIRAVMFDLDGVIRHFDADHVASVERRHGLEDGALFAVAFEPARARRLVTGRLSKAEWVDEVASVIGHAPAAEWQQDTGRIDTEVLTLCDGLRAQEMLVGIITNGTDTIPAELEIAGVTSHVDVVFNSAEIGAAKPDHRIFEHVCTTLELRADQMFFTDDKPSSLSGAVEFGMHTHLYTGLGRLETAMRHAGIWPHARWQTGFAQ